MMTKKKHNATTKTTRTKKCSQHFMCFVIKFEWIESRFSWLSIRCIWKFIFFCVCRPLLFRVSVHEYTFVMYVRALFFCSNCNDNRKLMLKQLGGIAYSCNLMTQPTNLLLLCFCCHFIVTFLILLIFFHLHIWFGLFASVFVLYRIYFYNLKVFFFIRVFQLRFFHSQDNEGEEEKKFLNLESISIFAIKWNDALYVTVKVVELYSELWNLSEY